jgi:hypothetical protein
MGLPPIASNEPVLSIVWDNVSIVHVGNAEEKAQGASYLADLAKDSRNASIICEEGGVPPLLRLLREGTPAGQEEAARALGYLAADRRRVLRMRKEGAITFFLEILVHGPMKVQVSFFIANLPAQCINLFSQLLHNTACNEATRFTILVMQKHCKILIVGPKWQQQPKW